jgi:hypothetical protein
MVRSKYWETDSNNTHAKDIQRNGAEYGHEEKLWCIGANEAKHECPYTKEDAKNNR